MKMNVDLTELLSVIVALIAIFGSIYSISNKEKRFDLVIAEIKAKQEMNEYRINGCYEALNHKCNRLFDEIKQLERKFEEFRKS